MEDKKFLHYSTGTFPDGAIGLFLEEKHTQRQISIICGAPTKEGPIFIKMWEGDKEEKAHGIASIHFNDLWKFFQGWEEQAKQNDIKFAQIDYLCPEC